MAEIQQADPRSRRLALMCVAVAAVLGSAALILLESHRQSLLSWFQGSSSRAQVSVIVAALVLLLAPLFLMAAWVWNLVSGCSAGTVIRPRESGLSATHRSAAALQPGCTVGSTRRLPRCLCSQPSRFCGFPGCSGALSRLMKRLSALIAGITTVAALAAAEPLVAPVSKIRPGGKSCRMSQRQSPP